MSKVYKSSHVNIGTPKPIINVFKQEIKVSAEVEKKTETTVNEEDLNEEDLAEAANSIIEDAKQMYLKIIEEANTEAQSILQAANTEAQGITAAAMENGYREGFDNGYREGRNEAQSIIEEASEIRKFLDSRKEELYREVEEQVLQLVLDMAKKVIGDELAQNNEAILSVINQAIQKCAFRKKLVLKVSPKDYDFVTENKDRICTMVEGISDIDILSELSLTQGSCIIETPSGEINSSIDVQIREVEKIFSYLLRNE